MDSIPKNFGKLLVTDGVFSMIGDLAMVPELIRIRGNHNARVDIFKKVGKEVGVI